jgi:hypothetical protein
LLIGGALGGARAALLHAGAYFVTVGAWIELITNGVQASEWYVVPVAAYLLAVGMRLRSDRDDALRPGSWVAYGPAFALLGASGVVERVHGGGSTHAVFAGVIGIVAIVFGAAQRLSAPLVLGTAVVAAVTLHETIGTAAGVPLSAWLATGGVALLGSAVAIERSDTSPIEAGRRVVDVLAEHFE